MNKDPKVIRLVRDHPALDSKRLVEMLQKVGYQVELVDPDELGQEERVWTERATELLAVMLDCESLIKMRRASELDLLPVFKDASHQAKQDAPWYRQGKHRRQW